MEINQGGRKMNNFYFTYGTSETMDFQGGHIVIKAETERDARSRYIKEFPNEDGIAHFAFSYTEEQWEEFKTQGLGFNKQCHLIIE